MINTSVVELLEKVDNRYSLVIVTSKRARQLIEGALPLIKVNSHKPLTVAISEVNSREVVYEQQVEGIK
jgi:DNA-directed RNA polymerase subunit omega